MIIPDINLLVYATDQESQFHEGAKAWLEDALSGTESIGFAWIVLLGFLRISTRAVRRPLTAEQALGLVSLWLAQPNVVILRPGPGISSC